jgi:hypothetical protein
VRAVGEFFGRWVGTFLLVIILSFQAGVLSALAVVFFKIGWSLIL